MQQKLLAVAAEARAISQQQAAKILQRSTKLLKLLDEWRLKQSAHSMRALGVDLGTKRIGLATSDASATIATPLQVLNRSGSRLQDHQAIAAIVQEYEIDCVVVGMPLSMSGDVGAAAQAATVEVAQMTNVVGVPVLTYDERLTTVSAHQILQENNVNAKDRKLVVDKVAAAVMLQSWLDAQKQNSING
jgi:putative Holliday junction resolvase